MAFIFKLRGSVKNYEWGKIGHDSAAAQLQKSAFEDFFVDDKTPYAEMWLGTHSSGPASMPSFNETKLGDWLLDHPECIGHNIMTKFGNLEGLPFLFKVLSVNKPLSIQVHPNKERARKLHEEYPSHYPDSNHKPEMAIALTDFQALCGFRPLSEIKDFLKMIPQLQDVIGNELTTEFINYGTEENLKPVFTALMMCSPNVFQPQLSRIAEDFKSGNYENALCNSIGHMFIKTFDHYPGDIGCFCWFFLNYLKLKCGEAIFLAANEPHAYLYGDCIECMACSDNVVRAGLTPKYRDVQTLCDILTYNCKPGKDNYFQPLNDPKDECIKIYAPPVDEFAVDQITITKGKGTYTLKAIQSASLLLLVKGEATYIYETDENSLSCGSVLFISSGFHVCLNPISDLLMFRAYCKD